MTTSKSDVTVGAAGALPALFQERGVRVTRTRQAVLEAVATHDEHFTAEEIVAELPAIGRATVYRTLKLLLEEGLICRVHREDGGLFYRLSSRTHHHHLVCVQCGATQDFDECTVSEIAETLAARTDFAIEGHWLEVFGRCPRCQATERAAS